MQAIGLAAKANPNGYEYEYEFGQKDSQLRSNTRIRKPPFFLPNRFTSTSTRIEVKSEKVKRDGNWKPWRPTK